MRKTIHAFAYFKINGVVVEEGFKVVCSDGVFWEFVSFNSDVLKAG